MHDSRKVESFCFATHEGKALHEAQERLRLMEERVLHAENEVRRLRGILGGDQERNANDHQ